MKKTNLAKKGLMPAVLGAVCSVVALTSVSYAWFTMGNTGKVEQIDVEVKAADGMQLSTNALDWKSEIDLDDFKLEGANSSFPTQKVMPVSTDGKLTNGALSLFEGKLDSDGKTVLTKSHEASVGNYVMFDLYVRLENDKALQLAIGSDVTNSKAEGAKESQIHYASRVAFIDLGSKSTEGEALQLDGTGVEGNAFIWEPNADKHTAQAIYQNSSLSTTPKVESIQGISGRVEGNKDYEQATFNTVKPSLQTEEGKGIQEATTILGLEKGINKIRVYIWVEGQDDDCLNDVSGSAFTTTLNFSIPQQ